MAKKKQEPAEDVRWLISYSDFMMQLVILFLLLFWVASRDNKQALAQISAAIRERFNYHPKHIPTVQNVTKGDYLPILHQIRHIKKGFLEIIEEKTKRRVPMDVEFIPQGAKFTFHVEAGDTPLFEEGSDQLTSIGREFLNAIAQEVKGYFNILEIQGYTSSSSGDTLRGDHWLLGYRRAEAALTYLEKNFSRGYVFFDYRFRLLSDGKTNPAFDNRDPNLRPYNQRIEVVVSNDLIPPALR